jgi:hypothetical protein
MGIFHATGVILWLLHLFLKVAPVAKYFKSLIGPGFFLTGLHTLGDATYSYSYAAATETAVCGAKNTALG